MESGIEEHIFGPTNLRERFPEVELTLCQWFLTFSLLRLP